MAKKQCNLSLDEETIRALDKAAKTLGMNRSQVANLVLAGALGETDTADLIKTMFSSAIQARNVENVGGIEFQRA